MNELGILCFLSVADTHSFSNTARELKITQQAVSRHIQKLEAELGYSLLIRDQNHVIPSVAGEHLLRFLRKSNAERQKIENRHTADTHTIHISISDWIGNTDWIQKSVSSFRQNNPSYSLIFYELDIASVRQLIEGHSIDCCIATHYELEQIHTYSTNQPIAEDTLCFVRPVGLEAKPFHLTSMTGENDKVRAKARDARLYHELSLAPKEFKLYPNYSSVLLNVSIGGGIGFGLQHGKAAYNPFFSFDPTSRKVNIVMGLFNRSFSDQAAELIELSRRYFYE